MLHGLFVFQEDKLKHMEFPSVLNRVLDHEGSLIVNNTI